MGSSRWDEASYASYNHAVTSRTADPVLRSSTAYTVDVRAGRAEGVHQLLNPHGVAVRESRDSAANPESLAIAVWFDVTGSMGGIPVVLQRKLQTLMRTLIERHYVRDPHVLFGAIGDATIDAAPLQVGQFEANIQMDEDMSRIYLEGGGGGNVTESYQLAHYFMARHTATDCWEKRQKKGYCFTIGDEMPYDLVKPSEVKAVCGEDGQRVTTAEIIEECSRRFHVFHLLADTQTSRSHPEVGAKWRSLLGDHVIALPDPDVAAELIAVIVGVNEGAVDPERAGQDLRAMGVDDAAVAAIVEAVVPFGRAIALRD